MSDGHRVARVPGSAAPQRRAAPGQSLVQDFPVLSAGPTPGIELEDWELTSTSETGTLLEEVQTRAGFALVSS